MRIKSMIKCELTRDGEKVLSVIEMVMISIDELSVNLLTTSLYKHKLIDDEKKADSVYGMI